MSINIIDLSPWLVFALVVLLMFRRPLCGLLIRAHSLDVDARPTGVKVKVRAPSPGNSPHQRPGPEEPESLAKVVMVSEQEEVSEIETVTPAKVRLTAGESAVLRVRLRRRHHTGGVRVILSYARDAAGKVIGQTREAGPGEEEVRFDLRGWLPGVYPVTLQASALSSRKPTRVKTRAITLHLDPASR